MLAGKRLRIVHTFYCCPMLLLGNAKIHFSNTMFFVSSAPLFIVSSHAAVLSQTIIDIIGLKFHRECLICWYDKGDTLSNSEHVFFVHQLWSCGLGAHNSAFIQYTGYRDTKASWMSKILSLNRK